MTNRFFLGLVKAKQHRAFISALGLALLLLFGKDQTLLVQGGTIPVGPTPDHVSLYMPLIQVSIPTPTTEPSPQKTGLIWDSRLDQRGARLIPAQVVPGQGYWQLIQAQWYNREQSQGKHHIFIETLNAEGARQIGVPMLIQWSDGSTFLTTQAKSGEPYAADFAMFALAPSYEARPDTGAPADSVTGMGLGEIEDPTHGQHTSYGLTWRWTLATAAPTSTPVVTPTITATATATATITGTMTATPTMTVTLSITATPTITTPLDVTATLTPSHTPTPVKQPNN